VIVIDTSAIVAIFKQEPERDLFASIIVDAERRILPAHSYLEAMMATSVEPSARAWIDDFVEKMRLATSAVDGPVARLAADAFFRYGKGRGHTANLNFGDCLSYAVAKHLGAPLLYKGDDFIHTDIESALAA
jgi:ribonuclease VapC